MGLTPVAAICSAAVEELSGGGGHLGDAGLGHHMGVVEEGHVVEPEGQQVRLAAVDARIHESLGEGVPDVGVVEHRGDRLQVAVVEHGLGPGARPVREDVGRLAPGQRDQDLVLEGLMLDGADGCLARLEGGVDVLDGLLAQIRAEVVPDRHLAEAHHLLVGRLGCVRRLGCGASVVSGASVGPVPRLCPGSRRVRPRPRWRSCRPAVPAARRLRRRHRPRRQVSTRRARPASRSGTSFYGCSYTPPGLYRDAASPRRPHSSKLCHIDNTAAK